MDSDIIDLPFEMFREEISVTEERICLNNSFLPLNRRAPSWMHKNNHRRSGCNLCSK